MTSSRFEKTRSKAGLSWYTGNPDDFTGMSDLLQVVSV